MALVTHLAAISISISLSAAPSTETPIGPALMLVPQATNSLNGDRYREYTSSTEVATDLAAGYIAASVAQWLNDALDQNPKPEKVLLGRVDVVGGESYGDGYTAVVNAGATFYAVCVATRVDADYLAVNTAMGSDRRLLVVQSNDADWLTASWPAGLSTLEDDETVAVIYHDSDSEAADLCWAANRLAFDPDTTSAPWICSVANVNAYAAMTSTQRTNALANYANVGLAFGTSSFFVLNGTNAAGRPVAHIVTMHWLESRWSTGLQALIQNHADRGEKLTINETGQAKVLGVLESTLQQGVAAGHFTSRDGFAPYIITPVTITQADIDASRMRFTGQATLAVGAKTLTVTFNLTTADIV